MLLGHGQYGSKQCYRAYTSWKRQNRLNRAYGCHSNGCGQAHVLLSGKDVQFLWLCERQGMGEEGKKGGSKVLKCGSSEVREKRRTLNAQRSRVEWENGKGSHLPFRPHGFGPSEAGARGKRIKSLLCRRQKHSVLETETPCCHDRATVLL